MSMLNRRVVVTGLGIVSPSGNTVETFWDNIKNGRSGIGPVTRFDCSDYPVRIAGEVRDFNPEDWVGRKDARRMDPLYSVRYGRRRYGDPGCRP